MAAKKEGYTDKLIRLPNEVWLAIDSEAERVHRSTTKQLEAILRERYGLSESVPVNDLQTVLTGMQRRMDEFEQLVRPLVEVVERKMKEGK